MDNPGYILSYGQYEYDYKDPGLLLSDLRKHARKRCPDFMDVLTRLQKGGWTDSDLDAIQSVMDSFLSSDPIGFDTVYETKRGNPKDPPIDDQDLTDTDIEVAYHHLDGEYLMWLLLMKYISG